MALARKCDRCKKAYTPYPISKKIQHNAVIRVDRDINGYIRGQDKILDLCPECMSAFNKWMIDGRMKKDD